MSLSSLERAIWRELQQVTGNRKIRLKDMMEWSTSADALKPREGEKVIHLPLHKVNVVYKETT